MSDNGIYDSYFPNLLRAYNIYDIIFNQLRSGKIYPISDDIIISNVKAVLRKYKQWYKYAFGSSGEDDDDDDGNDRLDDQFFTPNESRMIGR